MTPLHRLSPDQRLAEVAAHTTGDSYRASLEAGWDFQMDAQTSAQAEAFANPGAVNLFTSAGIDAEITRRTKGPNQRDTLNAAWDVPRRARRGGRGHETGRPAPATFHRSTTGPDRADSARPHPALPACCIRSIDLDDGATAGPTDRIILRSEADNDARPVR